MIKIEFFIVTFKYEYPIMWFDPLKRLSYGQIRFENNSLFTMMRRMKTEVFKTNDNLTGIQQLGTFSNTDRLHLKKKLSDHN